MDTISLRGVRTHNLKNLDIDLPRNALIVLTGLSGSGKSSLAFDTLYSEGQRRYVESLSAYARQFLSMMEKPDIDSVSGLSPAISIEQKSTSHNPRSTVGTITEIYDYLRLLFARIGDPSCPEHKILLSAQTVGQITDQILMIPDDARIMISAPVIRERKGEHQHIFNTLIQQGYIRILLNGTLTELDELPTINKNQKHNIDVVIDRLYPLANNRVRIIDSIETSLKLSEGLVKISQIDHPEKKNLLFSTQYGCPECSYSIPKLQPGMLSFNNPAGACVECNGLGVKKNFDPKLIIQDSNLSLAEGAVKGWDQQNPYHFHLLSAVASHFGFDIFMPFANLSAEHQNVILSGSNEPIKFVYTNEKGDQYSRERSFEGIIGIMDRRYRETSSSMSRENMNRYISTRKCQECNGTRLKKEMQHVFIKNTSLPDIASLSIADCHKYFNKLNLVGQKKVIADKILKEIQARLSFLINVGLNYLSLDRTADTLSGGEGQRIRLASQIGAGLVGVMYILDEPSIGLHQRDNKRLLKSLTHLRDQGNTVIIVEHDEETIRLADHIVDIGPGAGIHGGNIVAQGSLKKILASEASLTGKYLSGKLSIPTTKRISSECRQWLTIKGARGNNLKNITARFPLELLTCVTGVSGSGKSTLVNQTLYPIVATLLNKAQNLNPETFASIDGINNLDKVVEIDQKPIGRTPRSNPATYTGLFTAIRDLYSGTIEARTRGYKPGRFSFNVKGGRCEHCQGGGLIKVEMHFLPDIYVTCDLCEGRRYNDETLEILYKNKNISDVLNMSVEEAYEYFEHHPYIAARLKTLIDVGLPYIRLGQSGTTLSGGEAQRIKLAKELSRRSTGQTLYILDEPTTGLHFHDIVQLLNVLRRLRDQGNTIIVIEHNLDVIKTADWIIDLGPEGGVDGGQIIAEGTPEQVVKFKSSHTGHFLKSLLKC